MARPISVLALLDEESLFPKVNLNNPTLSVVFTRIQARTEARARSHCSVKWRSCGLSSQRKTKDLKVEEMLKCPYPHILHK